MKILLIDDEAEVLDALSEQLDRLGHQVIKMGGGFEALAYLESGRHVDLILTDVVMPRMDGWEVLETVRTRWPTVRIGIITGRPDIQGRFESPDILLTKPVRTKDLDGELSALGI